MHAFTQTHKHTHTHMHTHTHTTHIHMTYTHTHDTHIHMTYTHTYNSHVCPRACSVGHAHRNGVQQDTHTTYTHITHTYNSHVCPRACSVGHAHRNGVQQEVRGLQHLLHPLPALCPVRHPQGASFLSHPSLFLQPSNSHPNTNSTHKHTCTHTHTPHARTHHTCSPLYNQTTSAGTRCGTTTSDVTSMCATSEDTLVP